MKICGICNWKVFFRRANILIVCLLGGVIYAQEKFDYRDMPKEGVELIYQKFDVDNVVPGPSGRNVTWDFTTINKYKSTVVKNFVPPDSLARAEFPEANFMEILGDSIFRALKVEYGRTYSLGYVDKLAEMKITYPKPLLISRFPISFQDVISRDYTTTFKLKDRKFSGEGDVKIEADAFGRLRLPDTIYNGVMRLRISQRQADQIEKYEVTQSSSTTTYMWLERKHRYPIVILKKSTSGDQIRKEGLFLIQVVDHNSKKRNQRIVN